MIDPTRRFVLATYPYHSYYSVVQQYLLKKHKRGLSEHTLNRIYYNLNPIGRELENPPIRDITRKQLANYVRECWLHYAPETMRTKVGDIREFFRWCRKKKYTKRNLAKTIPPVKTRSTRYRRAHSADEADIMKTINHLATQLTEIIYRDIFGALTTAASSWSYQQQQLIRDLFVLVFMYESGLRVGELANLGSATFDAALTKTATNVYTITAYGKTNDRDYYFTNRTAELWHIWKTARPRQQNKYVVIGWQQGSEIAPISPKGISKILHRRSSDASAQPFRGQALRHAKIRRSKRLVGLETSSKLVDHSSTKTTAGYGVEEDGLEIRDAAVKTGLLIDPFEGLR